ncbi:MAG: hypothetical protein COZ75_13835 [Flavobacteriaceae bacterium CG_4_8_14_3_um_filter_34_10]|nr:DUF2007 domain-containing protein [Flavobacteriia bacterium]OIP52508.1 MAG: hypothetical protein AUK33_00705 [Flavobacteriaceae bacterium CG2_30_34_30]PIQ17837.1 MAG: hypothetical protein COW66_09665 [Flavobacteriaceae bacterium CG18_big_fil_WC_8_21_14_2_50_34_36]PIV50683.1 MAG: hypothetical protein COS19_03575 [Flavobacteriaceae bacterium CG02_land_8_20_14_3_00_34_13]PIX08084.1 MAG: hypothetical protein COZ75_13835 [Flavobacteriaceae bacterium CG_4_8_14_3_um_filter_34_10]PIZ07129.1 MAG: hy
MENNEEYVHIYTGPSIFIKMLQSHLEDVGIYAIIKDTMQSGLRSGFGGGIPGHIQLFIRQNQIKKAQPIIDDALKGIE